MGKLTVKQVSNILGISGDKLKRMVLLGEIKSLGTQERIGGKMIVFDSKVIYQMERDTKNNRKYRRRVVSKWKK